MTRNCDFVIHRFVKYFSEYRPVDGIIASHAGVFRGAVWEANGIRDII